MAGGAKGGAMCERDYVMIPDGVRSQDTGSVKNICFLRCFVGK